MNAKAYLAECEKGVEFWCSNQIFDIAIWAKLDLWEKKHELTNFCLPRPLSPNRHAENNAKIVAAVKGWFAQHPEELEQKTDASVPILKAILALWPGECPS